MMWFFKKREERKTLVTVGLVFTCLPGVASSNVTTPAGAAGAAWVIERIYNCVGGTSVWAKNVKNGRSWEMGTRKRVEEMIRLGYAVPVEEEKP